MDYGKVIQDSFAIFRKHKVLWLFGILLTLVGQGEYGFSVNYQESYTGETPNIPNPFDHSFFRSVIENPMPYLLGLTILTFMWWIISSFIGWLAQGALIGMVDEIKQTGTTSLQSGWKAAKARIMPLFSLSVVLALPQLILSLPVAIGGLFLFSQLLNVFGSAFFGEIPPSEQIEQEMASLAPRLFVGMTCLAPFAAIGSGLGWVLGILNKIAARSCVLENLGMIASIKRGWYIVRKHPGYTLLNWGILAVTGGIFRIVGAIPASILWIPMARSFLHNGWSILFAVTVVLMGFYLLIVVVMIGGALSSFNSTLWTRLYQEYLIKESMADSSNVVPGPWSRLFG